MSNSVTNIEEYDEEEEVENNVQVEYIGAEYAKKEDEGFKKKRYQWDPLTFGPIKRDDADGPGNGKGKGDGDDDGKGDGGDKVGRKALTDEEIRDLMQNDPAAAQFLNQIVPGAGGNGQKFSSEVVTI